MICDTTEIQKDILASLLVWGAEELRHEAALVNESDFEHELLRDMFIELKRHDFIVSAYITSVVDKEIRGFIGRLVESAIYRSGSFTDVLKQLRNRNSRKRLKEKLSDLVVSDFTLNDVRQLVETEQMTSPGTSAAEADKDVAEYIEKFREREPTISTGYSQIDSLTGGLLVPSVTVIGARPSTGKTTFALNIALKANVSTAFFSLEMPVKAIMDRLVSCQTGIAYHCVNRRYLSPEEEVTAIETARGAGERIKIFSKIFTIEKIVQAISEVKPQMAVIDFIQRIWTEREFRTEREKVNYIMGELRRCAMLNDCCIVALSQISRAGKDQPRMSDLLESGAIEANSDYVLLMHRPYVLDKANPELSPEDLKIVIDKNRYGEARIIDMRFEGKYQRVEGVDNRYEQ
jgi:replicative DNA helicase